MPWINCESATGGEMLSNTWAGALWSRSDEFSVRRINEEKYTEEERKAAFQDFKNIFDIDSETDYNKFQDKKIYNILTLTS